MASEGATRTVSAYGVSENQIYKNGQWAPVKSGSVSAYNMTEQKASSNASLAYAKANMQNYVKAYESSPNSTKRSWHSKVLSSFDNSTNSEGDAYTGLDSYATNFLKKIVSINESIRGGIEQATGTISTPLNNATAGIKQFEQEALHDIQGWSAGIKKALEPVGLCSAIGDLTDLAKNPLGAPQFLANSVTSLVNKISPGFVDQMDNAQKSLNLEGLSNLPSKMMGSLRNLATAADAILSVPFEIMSDVYNGLMEILEAIADLIDALVTTVMNLAMAAAKALLDAIIPTDMLIEFFSTVAELASFVGDIAGMVGGFSAVADIAGQVSDYSSLASNALSNPLGAAIQFIPGASDIVNQGLDAVGQVTGALRNPEQFLPPEIKQQMQNISNIPGLGFVGNLGYSVGDTLDTLSEGVFTKALDKFADKMPIINSAFNKQQTEPPAVDAQENHPDVYQPPKAGPHQTAQGIPSPAETSKILPESVQKEIDKSSTLNRFAPPPDKPWLNRNPNLGVGPTVDNAKKIKPTATQTTQGITYQLPAEGSIAPSGFSSVNLSFQP